MLRKCLKIVIEFSTRIISEKWVEKCSVPLQNLANNSIVLSSVLTDYQDLPMKLYGTRIFIFISKLKIKCL